MRNKKPFGRYLFLIPHCRKLFFLLITLQQISLNVIAQAPVIQSFSPLHGPVGTTVTIQGSNFGSDASNTVVFFGKIKAPIVSVSTTTITVTVPDGSTFHPIAVLNKTTGLTGYASSNFNVTYESLSSNTNPLFVPADGLSRADFAPVFEIQSVIGSYYTAIGDLDQDGKPDLITGNTTAESISIHKNKVVAKAAFSAQSFEPGFTLSTGTGTVPIYIAVHDLDGDGFLDIISANFNFSLNSNISIFRNKGIVGTLTADSFEPRIDIQTHPICCAQPQYIDILDMNGDGKPEICVSNRQTATVTVHENQSIPGTLNSSSFKPYQSFFGDTHPSGVRIRDLDGDQKPDFIGLVANRVHILQNKYFTNPGSSVISGTAGSGHYITLGAPGYYNAGVEVEDLDGDGKKDIIINSSNNVLHVYRNIHESGDITSTSFAPRVEISYHPTISVPMGQPTIYDIDGDKKPDIVLVGLTHDSVYVYKNSTRPGNILATDFNTRLGFYTGRGPQIAMVADLNSDQKPDIVIQTSVFGRIGLIQNIFRVPASANTDSVKAVTLQNAKLYGIVTGQNSNTTVGFEYSTDNSFAFKNYIEASTGNSILANSPATPCYVELSNLAQGTRYYFRVKATNAAGTTYGNTMEFTTATGISSMKRVQDSITNRSSVDFIVKFAQSVTGLSANAFRIFSSGISGAAITNVTGSGTDWTVTVHTGSGDGSLSLEFVNNLTLFPAVLYHPSESEKYTIDKSSPVLTHIKRHHPSTITTNRSSLVFQVQFAEPVTGVDISDFTVITQPTVAANLSAITGSGQTYEVTVDGVSGNGVSVTLLLNNTGTSIKDLAGNNITTGYTGESYTLDNIAPQILTTSIRSNNHYSHFAKPGDEIRVRFESNEAITTTIVTIASKNATLQNISGNLWEASVSVGHETIEGTIGFQILYTDIAGNNGTMQTTVTDNSRVYFDKTPPVVINRSIRSNNTNHTLARTGQTVFLDFTVSENCAATEVTISAASATTLLTQSLTYQSSLLLSDLHTEGIIPFGITVIDSAGNRSSLMQNTSDASTVTFDKTKPTFSAISISSDNTNPRYAKPGNYITVQFTSSESLSNPLVIIGKQTAITTQQNGNIWSAVCLMNTSNDDGAINFSIMAADAAGNISDTLRQTSSITFDKTTPSLLQVQLESTTNPQNILRAGDILRLSFTASEKIILTDVLIGVTRVFPTALSNNRWTVDYTIKNNEIEGAIPFLIQFRDSAGNNGTPVQSASNTIPFRYDITQPFVKSIQRLHPADSITSSRFLQFRVHFSERVSGIQATDFMTATVGTIKGSVSTILHQTDTTVDVAVHLTEIGGEIKLYVPSVVSNIKDLAGNVLRGGYFEGEKYISNLPPVFTRGSFTELSGCENDTAILFNTALQIADSNHLQPIHWQAIRLPSLGTLNQLQYTAYANSILMQPDGFTYQPLPNTYGRDTVVFSVNDGLQSDTILLYLDIHALPKANIIASSGTVICEGQSLLLSAIGAKKFHWWKEQTLQMSDDTSGYLQVSRNGHYWLIAECEFGCKAPSINAIQTNLIQKPVAKFSVEKYCINETIQVQNTSIVTNSALVDYLWTDNRGNSSTSHAPAFTYATTGTITLQLKVSSTICPSLADSITVTFTIDSIVQPKRLPTINTVWGAKTPLNARTIPGSSNIRWTPATGLSDTTSQHPNTTLHKEQQYQIIQTLQSGCIVVDTLLVRVFTRSAILVPNVFTPNHDGINDVVSINLVRVKQLNYFKIYNRWGNLVYSTNDPGKPWDGKINGVIQPLDTYIWMAEGIDELGVVFRENGNITLLR